MIHFSRADFEAVCSALNLDPATTLSINASPEWLRVVHTDQAVTSIPITTPEPDPDTAPA